MNNIISVTNKFRKSAKVLLGGATLAVFTLVSLYAFEMTPALRSAANEASAWHCESMTAQPSQIEKGESSTLSWSFAADSAVTVTIDKLPGEEWDGVSGSTDVTPTETTTYKAIAHKVGTTATYECSVTVTVKTPQVEVPDVPACPFSPSENVTVVNFNGGKARSEATVIRSDKTVKESTQSKSVSVPAGTYTIKTASWDGYVGRVTVSQPNEKWKVELHSSTGLLGTTVATTDIRDNVLEDTRTDTFTNAFTTTENGTSLKVVHAVYPDTSSANSVVPVCVALEKKPVEVEKPVAPACPFTPSANVTVVTFNQSGTTGIRSDKTVSESFKTASVNLPAGTYTVKTASWDGYVGREKASQPNEKWKVELHSNTGLLGTTVSTTDLDDYVLQDTKTDTFTNVFTTTEKGTLLKVVHGVYPDKSSPNSVTPICVALEKKPVDVEKPQVPACPFTPSENVTVVNFNGGKARSDATVIRSDKTVEESSQSIAVDVPAGTYTIKTASWDGYPGRETVSQPNEKWKVELRSNTGLLGTSGVTTDIVDKVLQNTQTNTFLNAFITTENGTSLKVVHAVYPDTTSANSVVPVCVALEKKPVVEVPSCDMFASPTSITLGGSAVLTWNSEYVNSVSISGFTEVFPSASSTTVYPKVTTTYVGTFNAKNGDTLTCSEEITVNPPTNDPSLSCEMNVSATSVNKGENVKLTWTSTNANSAFLNQGIGTTTLSGSKDITVSQAMSFTGLFKDTKGNEVTCQAKVSIKSGGGGGKCINCDDDDDDDDDPKGSKDPRDPKPSIVLGKTISKTGSFITLDQVPYTGFEAGPVLTTFFWLMVLAFSVGIAYVTTRVRPFERLQVAFANMTNNNNDDTSHDEEPVETNIHESVSATLQSPIRIAEVNSAEAPRPDAVNIIEDMAHKENILLSPEALRLFYTSIKNVETSPTQYLTGLFAVAKTEYPEEDGWILLSKERAEKLLGQKQNNTVLNVSETTERENTETELAEDKPFRIEQKPISKKNVQFAQVNSQATPASTSLPQTSSHQSDEIAVDQFIESLVTLEKKKVFDMIRAYTSRGNDAGSFITAVVRKLDEVYKHRIEGGHNPDKDVAQKTATWSNADFETVLGILVECIDYSYSNNHIGTKVALTKAFEHFEKKA